MARSYLDSTAYCGDTTESSEDEHEKVLDAKRSLHYFVGDRGVHQHKDPSKSAVVCIDESCTYLSLSDIKGSIDACEILGGESGVDKL